MELTCFHAFWGMNGTLRDKFERAAQHGYDGIEAPLPTPDEENEFIELKEELGLAYIPQIFTNGDHEESFLQQVEQAIKYHPVLINSHSGKDYWNEDMQDQFFAHAIQVEKTYGTPIGHETHRGRTMFSPWSTARLLRKFPDLRVTADFSHFTCVCESLLHDQEEDMALVMDRTIHLHARIGFEEGPQVAHPAAPEYAMALERFEHWWDTVFKARQDEGCRILTMTPEFGPPGYMPTVPFTHQPLADLFEVNHWMANRVKDRFSRI
ncbi:xylose isomerase [Paenibacillus selenitireducens]|uniref:Xylose isomerase n=1 Tax=Paenibacillus selenitireducens TaxID=1324314 RepID=A0A1T2X5M3_9BACL|nr:TIM barrel protein [Paenibacillus selenitireducens]OPA75188.1 xylose isomerase [Paenibacillus selenitireducens]